VHPVITLAPARFMRIGLHAFAILLSLFSIFPLLWMLSTAFKGPTEIFTPDLRLFPQQPTLENFWVAFQGKPVASWALNSGLSALCITLLRLVIAVPAAFAFTRERFRFKGAAFTALLGTMIIPQVVTLIPNYQLIVSLGWMNTLQGVIVPSAAGSGYGSAFCIFLLRQYMLMIPRDLFDAAAIDGAGRWRTLWNVVLPLVAPAIWAVVVLSFLDGWNLYLWPLLVLPSLEAQTLAVGMDTYASDPDTVQLWGPLMVVALLSAIPPLIVYAAAQKHLVTAFTTGLKG
jgi:ABC-type glycerol-3-phosphate transport system permease component